MRICTNGIRFFLLTFFGLFPLYSQADIVISGTRVIYPEGKSAVTVHLDNLGERPLLVQTWLDNGTENKSPDEIDAPFVITPPITRIDKDHGQTVRVIYTGGTLPQDRESLYWFNVLEVPPKDDSSASANKLQLAFRTRIKFIYRPRSLDGDLASALKKVKWNWGRNKKGYFFTVTNNSGYYLSMDKANIDIADKNYSINTEMLSPFGTAHFPIVASNGINIPEHGKINYSVVNDFGGLTTANVSL
ncbi:fimbrial chaperone [Salmonella enterica subsp. diarizonae]|uniref:fimbria/pilus periplasmic chaperone n=1 Tax=Salmonella enterica TaxID=28901 RepID=UPI0009ACCECD|nr:fimbria/pilus periplasmic chaperone [Salmonella enterica]EDL8429440.1 fimbrial chaperone [Salmonella enterica subsp. diarizonae]